MIIGFLELPTNKETTKMEFLYSLSFFCFKEVEEKLQYYDKVIRHDYYRHKYFKQTDKCNFIATDVIAKTTKRILLPILG